MDFNYRIVFCFFSTLKTSHEKQERTLQVCHLWPQYLLLLTGHTVTSCMSYFSATLRACVRNSELSLGACLPGQCHYYPQCLLWSVLVSVKACVVYAWTQPKSISCVPYAYMRVSVQSKSTSIKCIFLIMSRRESSSSCRFLNFKRCSLTLSLKSAVYLKRIV